MSIAQTIYTQLRQAGLTEAAALGMLGNWQCESGLETNRLENDYDRYRSVSKDYVRRATGGRMSKQEFCKGIGFGVAQWTYPTRKANLWDFWKKSGCALDNLDMQIRFALWELSTDAEFKDLFALLKSSNDLYDCTKQICCVFERPAIKNVDERFRAAKDIKQQIDLGDTVSKPQEGWEKIPATEFWPPRTICEGMSGKDVVVLRAVLYAHGFDIDVDDDYFDVALKDCVLNYQNAFGLDVDGIVGPITWGKLLERG